jgi:PKD repeat protein
MKKNIIFSTLIACILLWSSCEPRDISDYELGKAPLESEIEFTITQDEEDPFTWHFENTSAVNGLTPSWKIGETNRTGNVVSHRFPLPDEYAVSLTISTSGGSATKTQTFSTEDTDWDFLASPLMTAISGGVDMVDGKVWVLDASEPGHLGLGEPGSYSANWYSAPPFDKKDRPLYDDEFIFKLVGFEYEINTNGSTHVQKGKAGPEGIAAGYYTGVIWEDDYDMDVTVDEAQRGVCTWSVDVVGDKSFLVLSNPNFNIGYADENPRSYEIIEWTENTLHLRSVSDAGARYHKLIVKGYVRPVATFDVDVAEGADNLYSVGLQNLVLPEGATFAKYTVDFGNEEVKESTNFEEALTTTYIRKGDYNATVTVFTSVGEFTEVVRINVPDHHPSYDEFIIEDIIVYNNFSDIVLTTMGSDAGAELAIIENPSRVYPNRTSMAMRYTKENSQWANAFLQLPLGYRFDIRQLSTFKMMVYGKAGQNILLKLENTDMAGNAWQTGTELVYTIQQDDTWEIAEYDFAGNGTGTEGGIDVTQDARFSSNFYNVIRIMCNPGVGEEKHEFIFDELAGPHVEGLKTTR